MSEKQQTDSVSNTVPLPCANGCGFYGSPSMLNMCSKCFREHQKRTPDTAPTVPAAVPAAVPASTPPTTTTSTTTPALVSAPLPSDPSPASPALASAPDTAAASSSPAASTPTEPAPPSGAAPEALAAPLVADAPEVAASVEKNDCDGSAGAAFGAEDAAVGTGGGVDGGVMAAAAVGDPAEDERKPRKAQKNPGKCMACRKKVGLTGFKCRCGFVYCATHRYADAHACEFDYKSVGRQQLSHDNPLVVASKLEKI